MTKSTEQIMAAFEEWWNTADHEESLRAQYLEAWLRGAIVATQIDRHETIQGLLSKAKGNPI